MFSRIFYFFLSSPLIRNTPDPRRPGAHRKFPKRYGSGAIPILVALVFAAQFLGADMLEAGSRAFVKKSASGICHCPGGRYYDRTRRFTPHRTIAECLASGGRHPRRGQGDCSRAGASPLPTETGKREGVSRPRAVAARIVDGDTVVLSGVRVRLYGIDAPEAKQSCRDTHDRRYRCGRVATAALVRLASGGIRCRVQPGTDRYGRKIGTCYAADGTDINAEMVRLGHALAYRKYSKKYVPEEREARAGRRGLHRGAFVEPSAWRRGQRLPAR